MSADPSQRAANAIDSGSWNKYSYTRNDPVNRYDPSGLADFYVEVTEDQGCDETKVGCPGNSAGGSRGGGGGSGAGRDEGNGGGSSSGARDLKTLALEAALGALKNGPCKNLFGPEASRDNGFDPSRVLGTVITGGKIAGQNVSTSWDSSLNIRFLLNTNIASTEPVYGITGSFPFVGQTGVQVDIDTARFNALSDGTQQGIENAANILLHELGHVYNFLADQGSGGSRIVQDNTTSGASLDNTLRVAINCFN